MPSRLTNLSKTLTWNDFPRANRPEPPPNGTAHGAQIGVEIVNQGLALEHPAGGGVQIHDSIHVDIRYRRDQSWVANWVFNRPQSYQDGLLAHEQGHYNLVALLGRDFFLSLMRLKATAYPNAGAAQADLTAASAATAGKAQALQDRYDTRHAERHQRDAAGPLAGLHHHGIHDARVSSANRGRRGADQGADSGGAEAERNCDLGTGDEKGELRSGLLGQVLQRMICWPPDGERESHRRMTRLNGCGSGRPRTRGKGTSAHRWSL